MKILTTTLLLPLHIDSFVPRPSHPSVCRLQY